MAERNVSRGPALNYTLWTAQVLLAALFLFAGVMKFVMPVAEMTKQSSLPGWFFWFIGVCEILGGLGLILPATRRLAAWGLIALLIAVFPANLNMALNHLPLGDRAVPAWALWVRLPIQLVLIAWAAMFTRRDLRDPRGPRDPAPAA